MDFNKHESGTQRQIDRPQNVDELERFRDEILRALAPLEPRKSGEAGVASSIRARIQRTDDDVLATMPSYQYPTSLQRSSKPNFFLSGAMITVVGGALMGAIVASAGLAGVTLDDLSVTRWVTQLTGTSPNAVKNDETQAILNDTTEQAKPSQLSLQAPATQASAVADHPPSAQSTSSTAEAVQPANLAQPAVATPDPSQGSSAWKDGIATPTTNEGTLAATSDESSSPFAKEKKNAELYRQYIAWQADREQSQSEQRHSSKRTAETHASRKHRSNATNVIDNRSGSSSRESESPDRSNPTDKKDLAQQSENR
jgi:hypothetical protein